MTQFLLMPAPTLSVVITTKNEAANITNCLAPFHEFVKFGKTELIVVDNKSGDDTVKLARENGATVFTQGPERSAQRNRGWRESHGSFVLILDADMIMPRETIEEIFKRIESSNAPDAMYIREIRSGSGLRTKARNFERSFYDATCVDAMRLFRKSLLEKIGGYDEAICGVEDWDLDRLVLRETSNIALTNGYLIHNEKRLSLKKTLEKKAYYSDSFRIYKKKWNTDPVVRKQFGAGYRFIGIFVEHGKWRKILRHPLLFSMVLLERFCVGLVYLKSRR